MTRDSSVYSQWSRPDVFMPSNTFLIIRQLWIISASLFHHKTHERREHNLHNTRGLYCTWFHKRNPSGVEWSCFYPQTPCEFSIWDSLTADYNTIICQSDIKWVISLKWNSNLTQEFVDSFNDDSVFLIWSTCVVTANTFHCRTTPSTHNTDIYNRSRSFICLFIQNTVCSS